MYVAIFWTIIAWAERKYGSPRMIVITLSGHILASLTTIFLELWAINSGRAPSSLAMATDVGVSYIMVAGCAAAILLMKKWLHYIGLVAIGLFILLPLFIDHSIWDTGHLFATIFGFISARLLLKLSPVRTVSSPYELLLKCRSELSNK
ncbi:rhomboid-like protein [Lactococcus sp. FSL W8-0209]|uniref:rhomboid-like protein n=1 Tax=Lactococcus sp. FSL W8-0209 TaxID=2921712 RepID=UPI0030F90260